MSSGPHVEKSRSLAAAWVTLSLILGFLGWFKWKSEKDRSACISNLRSAHVSIRSVAGVHGINPSEPLDSDFVYKYLGDAKPTCPAGGTYLWANICHSEWDGIFAVKCSCKRHNPPKLPVGW